MGESCLSESPSLTGESAGPGGVAAGRGGWRAGAARRAGGRGRPRARRGGRASGGALDILSRDAATEAGTADGRDVHARSRARRRTAGVMRTPVGILATGAAAGAGAAGRRWRALVRCWRRARLPDAARGAGAASVRAASGLAGRRRARLSRRRGLLPPARRRQLPGHGSSSTSAMATSLATVSPSATRILVSVPSNGDGTSALTLSVTTSTRGSPMRTWSPTALSHFPMVPSSTPSPSWGMVTWGMSRLLGSLLAGSRWAHQGSGRHHSGASRFLRDSSVKPSRSGDKHRPPSCAAWTTSASATRFASSASATTSARRTSPGAPGVAPAGEPARARGGRALPARHRRAVAARSAFELDVRPRWQGADLDRVLSAAHADLHESVVRAPGDAGRLGMAAGGELRALRRAWRHRHPRLARRHAKPAHHRAQDGARRPAGAGRHDASPRPPRADHRAPAGLGPAHGQRLGHRARHHPAPPSRSTQRLLRTAFPAEGRAMRGWLPRPRAGSRPVLLVRCPPGGVRQTVSQTRRVQVRAGRC